MRDEKKTTIFTSDQEGKKIYPLLSLVEAFFSEELPSRHDNGDIMDKGPDNFKILRDINENVKTVCLGNRDLNLIKRNKILFDNLEKLLQPEIDFYNNEKSFNKICGTLANEYLKLNQYSRPSNLMWNDKDLLLVFLKTQNLLNFAEDGTISLNTDFLNDQVKTKKFRMDFLKWECENNQGAGNYVDDVLKELRDKLNNTSDLEDAGFDVIAKFHKEDVIKFLKKAKFVVQDEKIVYSHSTIRPEVLNIPISLINLLRYDQEGRRILEQVSGRLNRDYINLFDEKTTVFKVTKLSDAINIHNYAWSLYWKYIDSETNNEGLKTLLNAAEQSFIEFALPNNPQGFVSASQIENGTERRSEAELIELKKMVDDEQKLLINIVGHKPTEFYSVAHQVIDGLNLYTIRADLSMSKDGVLVTSHDSNYIEIQCIQEIDQIDVKDDIEAQKKVEFNTRCSPNIRIKYTIDAKTGELLESMQLINNKWISLPLAERYYETEGDGKEWRVATARINPENSELEYILTFANGDNPYTDKNGNEIPKYDKRYRIVSTKDFENEFYNVNLHGLSEEQKSLIKEKQTLLDNERDEHTETIKSLWTVEDNLFFANKNNKANLNSYRMAVGLAALAGGGLAAASLLAELPFTWHLGVAVAGAAVAVLIVSAVIKLGMNCGPESEQTPSYQI